MKRRTAGQNSVKASQDNHTYDPLELGHAMADDISDQLRICAETHSHIFNEDEFCLVMVVAGDPLIQNLRRHKYYGYLYLPQPRPQQAVFLFNKITQTCRRLWSLPSPKVMAVVSSMSHVAPRWALTKIWCDFFYEGRFHERIREMYDIDMLSESEYLDAHRSELIQAGADQITANASQPFDFSKITVEQVIDKVESVPL